MKSRRIKNRSFLGMSTSGRWVGIKRGNEDEYGGCILYSYMKREE
jgi:hypothetical protein